MEFQKGHESEENGWVSSKFWLELWVKIRIFYVLGPHDMEYWLGLGVKVRTFHVLGP
jgi:hypothetical protein